MEKKKLVNRIYRTEKEEWHTEIKKYEEREKRRKKKKATLLRFNLQLIDVCLDYLCSRQIHIYIYMYIYNNFRWANNFHSLRSPKQQQSKTVAL